MKPRLLAIDDEVGFLEMIKSYFSLRGYEVFTAIRGSAGLDIIAEKKPEVVLVDLKLPEMDGEAILQKMKKIHPEGKAIMVTAFKDEGQTEKKFLNMGGFAYFEKPLFSMKEFENSVEAAVSQARS